MLILMNNLQRRKHNAYIQGHLKTEAKQIKAFLEMTRSYISMASCDWSDFYAAFLLAETVERDISSKWYSTWMNGQSTSQDLKWGTIENKLVLISDHSIVSGLFPSFLEK